MFEHSLAAFQSHEDTDAIILIVPAAMLERARATARRYPKVEAVVPGGKRRQDSVRAGLDRIGDAGGENDLVLVHDAARPFVPARVIVEVLRAADRTGAAVPATVPSDTIREIAPQARAGGPQLAGKTLDRRRLVQVQTPQGFRLALLRRAFELAGGMEVTDDAALVEAIGSPVELVDGSPRNFKITTPDDLRLAEACLR